ncbi:MAG TPA: YfhO family protein [Thermoanaerobaculia bacterium]|nr:YfhO family protein [Thermoanaerobaculia bacterium]
MSGERRTDLLALAILTAIIAVFFIDVLEGRNALYLRDISHYYYPAKHVLREIVLGGEFPYWNPLLAAGQPMAANPEHEVFYPLTWLILLPSYDFGFRLLLVLHIQISAWTMYALLRSMRNSPAAAFIGALSFAMGGVVLSCLTLLPILFVLAWLPLTCLFTRRYLLERRPRDFGLAAMSLGLQMLVGEPTTVAQTGFLLGAYAIALGIRERSPRPLLRVALISVAALAVAAVMFLPAVDHAADSVRARGFTYEVVTTWSAPLARIGELLFPHFLGHHNPDVNVFWGARLYDRATPFFMSIYPGLLIAVMLIAGLVLRVRGAALTGSILAVSWLLALGSHTPLWRWLYDLGLAQSVRYPEKYLLMGVFAATVFGARVLEQMLAGDDRLRRTAMRVAAVIGALAAVLGAITMLQPDLFVRVWRPRAAEVAEMLPRARTSWLVAVLFAALLALLLRNLPMTRRRIWIALVALLVVLDLGLVFPELTPRMPASYLNEPPPLAKQLPANRQPWRLLHAIEWQSQDVAFRPYTIGTDLYWIRRHAMRPMMPARWGIRSVMEVDYDQTALRATTDFVEIAYWLAHGRKDWPALIAPMANARYLGSYEDPQTALARVGGDRRRVQPVRITVLGDNPRYFFAERVVPIRAPEDFAGSLATARSTKGVAYVEDRRSRLSGQAGLPVLHRGVVRGVRETANTASILVETEGRALLVISVTPHKYWRVTIDGAETEALKVNVGFQGVVIPTAGQHIVEMRYRNPLIAIGAAISLLSLLALAFITMRRL